MKMNKFYKLISSIILLVVNFTILNNVVFAYNDTIFVKVNDTIAGKSTLISSSGLSVDETVIIDIEKPNGKILNLNTKSNNIGAFEIKLDAKYLDITGVYRVSAHYSYEDVGSTVSFFNVYPSVISLDNSKVRPLNQVVNVSESVFIDVELLDENSNPLKDHEIKLITSSSEVSVKSDKNYTDINGKVRFTLSSDSSTPVTVSVYDVSTGIVLNDRAKVAFINPDLLNTVNTPSNGLYAASGAASGPASKLKFESLPSKIAPADSVSFAITAYDDTDQIVSDYVGTVRFSVLSDNYSSASLPNDYTFSLADQGSHTFSLSLSFNQSGEYLIESRDIDNTLIFGEQSFTVSSAALSVDNSSGITIINPIAGTYSNNIQVISGTANPGEKINVFDNNILLSSLVADINGNFSYTTPTLVDGAHTVYIAVMDTSGAVTATSDKINYTIDTSAPEISEIKVLTTDGLYVGKTVEIQIYMLEELSSAAVVIDNNIFDLTFVPEGAYYSANVSLPLEAGVYGLDFVLVDMLGNESKFTSEYELPVELAPAVQIPTVQNLIAIPDSARIILKWDEVLDTENPIAYYRLFYGLSSTDLVNAVDTYTNSPTWYIPNLTDGVRYYFAVVAVDSLGNISQEISNISSTVPEPAIVEVIDPNISHGVAGDDVFDDMKTDVSNTGPAVMWLVYLSLVLGFVFVNRKKLYQLR